MDDQGTLREIVAEALDIAPGKVRPELPFAGTPLQGSLARARLDAAVRRRLGRKCPAVYQAHTYAELEAAVLGTGAAVPGPAAAAPGAAPTRPHGGPAPSGSPSTQVACGIDIELVENLPEATDYWQDEFYRTHFARSEIAHCLTQENPRMHFAARWCAKEALKKCDAAFLHADLSAIEVAHDEAGAPSLRQIADGRSFLLPFAVSLSHTPLLAVAVVVKLVAEADDAPRPALRHRPTLRAWLARVLGRQA